MIVHHKDGDLGAHPSFPELIESLRSCMSAEYGIVKRGLNTLHEIHRQYPRVDSSFIEIALKGQPRGISSAMSMEVRYNWLAFERNEAWRRGLELLYQSYHRLAELKVNRDNQIFRAAIEVRETFETPAERKKAFLQRPYRGAEPFNSMVMSEVLKTSHQKLVKLVNEDGVPLDQSIIRLAAYVFESIDTIAPQNYISDVLVSLKASEERLRYAMSRDDFDKMSRSILSNSQESAMKVFNHTAFIALGSNVGDRIAMLEAACALMNDEGIQVRRTSALYETAPMYLEQQGPFINGVCQVRLMLAYHVEWLFSNAHRSVQH